MNGDTRTVLYLAFLGKWLPESGFIITYVGMKKKSLKGPDAQGPRSEVIPPDFLMPSSEAEICSLELLTKLSYTAEGKTQAGGCGIYNSQGTEQRDAEKMLKRGMCLQFPLSVPGIRAPMRERDLQL